MAKDIFPTLFWITVLLFFLFWKRPNLLSKIIGRPIEKPLIKKTFIFILIIIFATSAIAEHAISWLVFMLIVFFACLWFFIKNLKAPLKFESKNSELLTHPYYYNIKDISKIPCDLTSIEGAYVDMFPQEVIGESNYQINITQTIFKTPINQSKFSLYALGELVLEDENEYDKNAVKVLLEGRTVGYLPRDAAIAFRKKRKKEQDFKSAWSVHMAIHGKNGICGLWLNIDI